MHRVSRRYFLEHVAAVAMITILPNQFASCMAGTVQPNAHGRIRKAAKYHMIKENISVPGKFQLLADLGFKETEIHVTTKIDRNEVRKAIDATGVVVHGFLNSTHPDLKNAIDNANFYGATNVLIVAGKVNEDHPYDTVYREQQQRIQAAAPYADQHCIKLLVENVWNNFLLSPLEMARFVDEIQSPAVGVYFDVGNVVRYGWPEQWIRILGPRIVKLDIKEYSCQKQQDEGLWKGFASSNWRRRL